MKPVSGESPVVAVLLADYRRRVAEVAERVRGWVVAVPPTDAQESLSNQLERAAREEFCRSAVEARLVRAVSRYVDDADIEGLCDRDVGSQLAALDIAAEAGAQWFLKYWRVLPVPASKPCACGRQRVPGEQILETWDGEHHGSECSRLSDDESGRIRVPIPPRRRAPRKPAR